MEQFDFDKIIKDKVSEETDIHLKESTAAKPFVWSAVQKEITPVKSLKWYHLAAAIVLIILMFSYMFSTIREQHQGELESLSNKILELENKYTTQSSELNSKQQQVSHLEQEVEELKYRLVDLDQKETLVKETIVYKTDTVYVRQVEYITETVPVKPNKADPVISEPEITEASNYPELDQIIYPSTNSSKDSRKNENVKVRFGSFVAKNN